ncbi:hypothetical protein RRG08_067430 [Elysia crispata]|uniref:Uncharacterized protein n=1 Tax=Elysia crispata TaxID=231223 RepID=A0AAE1DEM0_9GAST|nr:hypothetical protein RRG08_067430 [Elysia crispata]
MAIRGLHWHSEAFIGHYRPSMNIRRLHWRLDAAFSTEYIMGIWRKSFIGHQRPLLGHQQRALLPSAIKSLHWTSEVFIGHQRLSLTIRGLHWASEAFIDH